MRKENQQLQHELDKVSQQPIQEEKLSFEMCDSPAPRPMHRGSDTKVWSTLPMCPRDRFTLTVINGLVTAVGGRQSNKYTNTLLSLMEEGGEKKWVEYFERMPTKRSYTAVVCGKKALVVAGGEGKKDAVRTTVEVMNTDTQQWSTASSLPHPLSLKLQPQSLETEST